MTSPAINAKIRNELDGLAEPVGLEKHKTRRKKEGAFYTPEFITRYIIEQALGPVLKERFERLRQVHAGRRTGANKAALADPNVYDVAGLTDGQRTVLMDFWTEWEAELTTIRLLDPACGSGAFLIEAFNHFRTAYQTAHDRERMATSPTRWYVGRYRIRDAQAMLLYALVVGARSLPFRKGRGHCPACSGKVLAKCGSIRVHHWAHESGRECDAWAEGIGPWHLSWQNCVRPEFVEVPMGEHRADIVGHNGIVIELQHSPLSAEEVRERETFYGNMVWLIDATRRFGGIVSGRRFFFSFGRTRHLQAFQKPVVLDFQDFLVEVEALTDTVPGFSGFGMMRDRDWFVERYLAACKMDGALQPRNKRIESLSPWASAAPWKMTRAASAWFDASLGIRVVHEAGTPFVPLLRCGVRTGERWPAWWDIIARHPLLANGWTQGGMQEMLDVFAGTPAILGGSLRLLPGTTGEIKAKVGETMMTQLLQRAEEHARAGRMPVLEERIRVQLMEQAGQVNDTQVGYFLAKMGDGRGHRRWLTGRA